MNQQNSSLVLSWRIGLLESEEGFERLRRLLRDYPTIVDEVAFFETVTHHLYIPLEEFAATAARLGRQVRTLKRDGVRSVGINVLTTIGHMNEGWDYMPRLPFQPMVGQDGSISKSCACPNTAEFRRYVREKYTLVARERPDFIWVDDDIRMHHHGVAYGCFCPTCLSIFNRVHGTSHTRESLVQALNDPEQARTRQAWVEQNIASIESLLRDVAEAICRAAPDVATGLMTAGPGWTTYSGVAFGRWFRALRATKARPGGGFYSDATPIGMVYKAFEVGRQCVLLPSDVKERQYELENFPYATLGKSVQSLVNECSLALAAGVTGIAFNALGGWGNPFDEYRPILERVERARPFWESLVRHVDDLPMSGLWPAWSAGLMARRSVRPGEDWFAHDRAYDTGRPLALAEIGLPLCSDRPGLGVVLSGRIVEVFEEADLRQMLAGGVMMDSSALDALYERGLGELAGVRIARRIDNGVMERFTGDPLNGPYAGFVRDARIEFWGDAHGQADVLEPVAQGVRVLALMENYFHRTYGPCVTAFENQLGGRVVVLGYAPWMFLGSRAKRAQLLDLSDWLARDLLPVRIDEPVRLIPFARLSADRRRGAVVLLNAGFDRIERVTIHLRVQASKLTLAAPEIQPRHVDTCPESCGCSLVLQDVEPWGVYCLLFPAS